MVKRTKRETITRTLDIPWASAAVAVAALALASVPAHAAPTVWNVNIGAELTTRDNFAGAAPENTVPNSFWNSATPADPFTLFAMPLADSTGTASTATLTLSGTVAIGYTNDLWAAVTGPEIFSQWIKTTGNATPFTMTIGGLNSSKTYDILFYSDWYWKNGDSLPITQTAGTGLSGTFFLNRILTGTNGTVPALTQDINPANVTSGTGNIGNYCRIVGIVPDGDGKVSFPQLKEAAGIFDKGEGDFPQQMSVGKAADVRKAIAEIEAATNKPELRRIR